MPANEAAVTTTTAAKVREIASRPPGRVSDVVCVLIGSDGRVQWCAVLIQQT